MKHTLLIAVIALVAGCTSVATSMVHMKPDYSQLPEQAMRDLANELEQAVQMGNRTPAIADREGIVVNTDLILQTIRTRAARIERVNALLGTGHVVEKRNGLLYIIRTKAYKKSTTRQQRDRDALVVMGENGDRWALYEGLLEASQFPPRALSAIQEIFHIARVEAMPRDAKYEDASGNVMSKNG